MQGVVRWWWGWSVFVALTFRNPPQLLPADAAQLPIRGHSHSTKPEMSRSIKCSPTCCLPNDTKKSLLVCYLQPNWLKATDLSHHWVLCGRVHHSPAALQGTYCHCEVEHWRCPVRHLGNCLFILVTDSPPLLPPPLPQVTFKPDLSTAEVHDENIKGPLKVRQERWGRLMSHSQLGT